MNEKPTASERRLLAEEARIRSLEAQNATLTAEVMHYTAGTPHPRVTELEAALAMMRHSLDKAAKAMAEGDVVAMLAAHEDLKTITG